MSDKPPKVTFAPGCFDDFDGTPEELQELIAAIHRMVADGTLDREATPVPEDEAEEIMQKMAERQPRH